MKNLVEIQTASKGLHTTSLLIIYAGGTFGMAYGKDGSLLKPFDFKTILEYVPELNRLDVRLTFVSISNPSDSSNFNTDNWIELAEIIYTNYDPFDGFVILHGTDTMAFTASALSFMLENLSKPVILTGAQLPIGVPRTDARENFITSLEIASARNGKHPVVTEVCIYFEYVLLRGNRAKKVQSNYFDAFVSENYPVLAEAGINIEYRLSALYKNERSLPLNLFINLNRNVVVLKIYPGIQEETVKSIVSIPGLKVIIMETFGTGNGPTYAWFIDILKKAIDNGVTILNITQSLGGKVIQGKYETSKMFQRIGVISGVDLTFESAIAKSMYLLGHPIYNKEIGKYLATPLRGEMEQAATGIFLK